MKDWTDSFNEEIIDMLHVLVQKHHLKSGDISPEDHVSLCQIVSRYIKNNKVRPNCITQDKPNFIEHNGCEYYFDQMMCVRNDEPYPLRWDDEGKLVDFFDWNGDQFWIDCGPTIKQMYLFHLNQKTDSTITLSNNEISVTINHLNTAIEINESDGVDMDCEKELVNKLILTK